MSGFDLITKIYLPTILGELIKPKVDLETLRSKLRDRYPQGLPLDHIIKSNGTNVFVIAANGLDRKDFEIYTEGDCLHIKAVHPTEEKDENDVIVKHSLIQKDFNIVITAGTDADLEKVSIDLSKGNLYVSIPVKEECKPVRRELTIN